MKDFNDLVFDDDYRDNLAPVMTRQRYKMQLLKTTNAELEELAKSKVLWGKDYKKSHKDFMKDYRKGIKVINKKNPVYIEMPTLKEVGKGKGQYKTVADKKANANIKQSINEDEIHVDYTDVPQLPSN